MTEREYPFGAHRGFDRVCVGLQVWGQRIFCGLMIALLGVLSLLSCVMSAKVSIGEHVTYPRDAVWPCVLMLFLAMITCWQLLRQLARWRPTKVLGIVLAWTAALAVLWLLLTRPSPTGDAGITTADAYAFSGGEYGALSGTYFRYYPFQAGITLYKELCFRLVRLLLPARLETFGRPDILLQFLNIGWLCGAYAALHTLLGQAFPGESGRGIRNTLSLLLPGCLPAVFFCTFEYGTLPGLCGSLWAAALQAKFLRTGQKRWMAPALACIALACLMKPNYLIAAVALCIQLLLCFLRKREWLRLAAVPLCALCVFGAMWLPQAQYEWRSGQDLGKGIPKLAWMAMGLGENSYMTTGWWDPDYTVVAYDRLQGNVGELRQESVQAIRTKLENLAEDPAHLRRFVYEKVTSQWCEPAYQSIWNSWVCSQYSFWNQLDQGMTKDVYEGRIRPWLDGWMNLYQPVIYLFALAGLLALLRRGDPLLLVPPVTVFGGFLYHLFFEGKAQYILPFFVLLLPVAALGLWRAQAWFDALAADVWQAGAARRKMKRDKARSAEK
ncbi:MAG: hypothetical protein LBJ11_10880 [Oscillospiraceae bacterium]|nr:hypothetical protein [Oscillospiraceae bacterium]